MDLGCYNLKETCLSDINLEILTRKMSKNNNYMHISTQKLYLYCLYVLCNFIFSYLCNKVCIFLCYLSININNIVILCCQSSLERVFWMPILHLPFYFSVKPHKTLKNAFI